MLHCNFPSASRSHRMPTLVSPVCRAIQYCTKNVKQWQCCTVYNSWDIKMSFIAFWQCLETFQRLFNSILSHWLNWTVGDWLESNNRHLGGVSTFAEARGGRGGGILNNIYIIAQPGLISANIRKSNHETSLNIQMQERGPDCIIMTSTDCCEKL